MADLISRTDYKDWKGVNSNNKDKDIDALLPMVSRYVKQYCHKTFIDGYGSPGLTEYFNSNDTEVVLNEFPVLGSPAPTVSYSTDGGVTYTALVENTDFFVDLDEGSITTGDGLKFYATTIKHKSLRVAYRAGFLNTPADIKLAALLLLEYFQKEQYISNKAVNANIIQTFPPDKLPNHIRSILEGYREIV